MYRRMHSFYLDPELSEGLRAIKDRDGIPDSEQVRRAVRVWLETKGLNVKPKGQRKRKGDSNYQKRDPSLR